MKSLPAALKSTDKMSLHFVLPLVFFYLTVGVLLIWLDSMVITIASYVLAALLILTGAWLLIRYHRSGPQERVAGMDLAVGLILLFAGVLLILKPEDLAGVFPQIWGLSLVFGGFMKVQYAFDEKTVGISRWWIMLIFAALSLIIGILAFFQESVFSSSAHLVIGIFMLGEAVLDLVTFLIISRVMKRRSAEKEAAIQAAVTAANTEARPAAQSPAPEEIPAGTEEE